VGAVPKTLTKKLGGGGGGGGGGDERWDTLQTKPKGKVTPDRSLRRSRRPHNSGCKHRHRRIQRKENPREKKNKKIKTTRDRTETQQIGSSLNPAKKRGKIKRLSDCHKETVFSPGLIRDKRVKATPPRRDVCNKNLKYTRPDGRFTGNVTTVRSPQGGTREIRTKDLNLAPVKQADQLGGVPESLPWSRHLKWSEKGEQFGEHRGTGLFQSLVPSWWEGRSRRTHEPGLMVRQPDKRGKKKKTLTKGGVTPFP